MKRYMVFLIISILFISMISVGAYAVTLKNFFKLSSKNTTTVTAESDAKIAASTKTTASADTKCVCPGAEDKTAFEKEYQEKDSSKFSKDEAMEAKAKMQAKTGVDTKTGADTKTSEKTKEMSKTKTKWKVSDEGKLQIDGKADSVCISLPDQTLDIGEGAPQQKQYEHRSGKAECRGGFFSNPTDDDVVEIVECSDVELKAKCRQGFVLNYGGSCSYGDDVNQQFRGIEKLYTIPAFFDTGWNLLPASNEVVLLCSTGLDLPRGFGDLSTNLIPVDKTLYITCVREKN